MPKGIITYQLQTQKINLRKLRTLFSHCSIIDLLVIFRDSDDDARDDPSVLSDNEASRPTKPAVTPTNENEDADESSVQLTDHDWSFLSTIFPDEDNIVH